MPASRRCRDGFRPALHFMRDLPPGIIPSIDELLLKANLDNLGGITLAMVRGHFVIVMLAR